MGVGWGHGRVRRSTVAVLIGFGVLLSAVACGGNGDSGGGNGNGASEEFCETVANVSADPFSANPARRQELADQLNQMVATAPAAIRPDVTAFQSLSQRIWAYLDRLVAAGPNAARQQQLAVEGQQLGAELAPVLERLNAYLTDNCPGVTVPTTPGR